MRSRYSPGTEPGALQNRAHEDRRYFGTQNADSPPTGNTFEETMGAASQWANPDDDRIGAGMPDVPENPRGGDDDIAYRSHQTGNYEATGIHDDDLAQAYLHGSDAARDSNYGGHHWKDVETRLKSAWERTHAGGGPSAWDKVKAAVRHGWDRVKS
jgi:hypothetical protein